MIKRVAYCVCLLAISFSGYAYPTNPLYVKGLVESAGFVCHGRVLSVSPGKVEPDTSFYPPLQTEARVARIRVLNVIKGNAAETLDVVFPVSTNFVMYTELERGQEYILFLRKQKDTYKFVDEHNGALLIPSHQPLRYKSSTPNERMTEELIFATKEDTGVIRLICTEQLANFTDDQAVSRLKELARNSDMAVQGVAYSGLIKLDCPPSAKDISDFFARQDDTKSLERFRTTGYSNGNLKGGILNNLEGRFNVIGRDNEQAAAEKWKDFDLIGFLKSAPWQSRDVSSVRDNTVIAEIIREQIDEHGVPSLISKSYRKGSKTIVLGLLNSQNTEIRFAAAVAIDRMIADPHKFPFPGWRDDDEGRKQKVETYVNACRDWLAAHKQWASETD